LRFSFDHIFGPQAEQKDVFNHIGQPIVNTAFEGINGTIFAYGQTSSGKTFTCVGPDCEDA
jgi:kinesin family member 5